MADEHVFRFLALRRASQGLIESPTSRRRVPYSVTGETPPFVASVLDIPVERRTPERLRAALEAFRATDRYVHGIGDLPFDMGPLVEWSEAQALTALDDLDLPAFLEGEYGDAPAALVKKKPFGTAASMLAETLFAHAIADGNESRRDDTIVQAIKLLNLVQVAAEQPELLAGAETLQAFLARSFVSVPVLDAPPQKQSEPTVTPPSDPDPDGRVAQLREKLAKMGKAHAELRKVIARPDALKSSEPEQVRVRPSGGAGSARMDVLEAKLERLALRLDKPGEECPEPEPPPPPEVAGLGGVAQLKPKVSLADSAVEALSPETLELLGELRVDLKSADPFSVSNLLEEEMADLGAVLPTDSVSRRMISFGGIMLDATTFGYSYGFAGGIIDPTTLPGPPDCDFNVGIGDLLIVRQNLKAYELGEFAHVENVMQGEFREREHRRLSLREEITTEEVERETETERDLQSTERFEMQNEASKTVESQFEFEAGLQISGSYGPSVSFSANMSTGFSTSTSETQRKAVSYSREVTDKTSERIRERVREEQRRRVLEQVEEINIHRLQNTEDPQGHIRGIYRWLNKIYDAQVFNYGQRMMYEFVLPEPAAFFLYATVTNPPQDMELEKPEPPMYYGSPLKPENLSRTNYQAYLAQYDVTSAKAPPPSFTHVAFYEKQEGKEESHYERGLKIGMPDGYEATGASTWYWYVFGDDDHNFRVAIGSADASGGVSFGTPRRGEVSVGVHAFKMKAFVVTGDIYCRLTTDGFAKWQHETFESIIEAYLDKKAVYEDKLAQQEVQEGVKILGRNPLENRRIESDELRKLAIMTLMGNSYLDIDSFYGTAEPIMNLSAACENGKLIRFFENAFEWRNMTYVHYPYFWGRHARWINALHLTDPDPDFAAFLRAGASRVQVPVRPGFESAVAYYCQTGIIWEGGDVPLIDDDLYVPIVEEISENLGQLDEGVPYPEDSEPWEVTVPTSLVVVQNLEEIPQIRDILTGEPIALLNDGA